MPTCMGTGIFAQGDGRWTSRHIFDSEVTNLAMEQYFAALELLSEAKLISILRSIFYSPSGIPDGDSADEFRIKILLKYSDVKSQVIEIPCSPTDHPDVTTWFATNKAKLIDDTGAVPVSYVLLTPHPERKARGR